MLFYACKRVVMFDCDQREKYLYSVLCNYRRAYMARLGRDILRDAREEAVVCAILLSSRRPAIID